jgi:hypothetical protein
MKAASINEIRKDLSDRSQGELQDLCLRLARYKKENKELLTYLLFEADNESAYVATINADVDELFATVPQGNVYFVKKTLRKILRIVNKHVKYSAIPQTEVEVRIHFCKLVLERRVPLENSQVLSNMYEQQLRKIDTALSRLPDDLQFDYANDIERIKKR